MRFIRADKIFLLIALSLVMLLSQSTSSSLAHGNNAESGQLPSSVVVLSPNASVSIPFSALSLSRGLPLPDQTLVANGQAPIPIQVAIEYSFRPTADYSAKTVRI